MPALEEYEGKDEVVHAADAFLDATEDALKAGASQDEACEAGARAFAIEYAVRTGTPLSKRDIK